jgi:glycosyltransferase involved in cell wall biosynthesis
MQSSLNLLFVIPAYEPAWAFGGVVRCISNLCRGLAALGHRVTVYTLNADGLGGALKVPCGHPVDQGGVLTYFFRSLLGPASTSYSRQLVEVFRRSVRNYDLVYVSAIWQWLGLSIASICAKQQVPLVIGTHGSFNKTHFQRKKGKKYLFWHIFLKKALSRAAAIHYTTRYERNESANLLGNLSSFVVHNGIDCNYFCPKKESRPDFRHRYIIPERGSLVITVTRADPGKRVDLLIQAMALLPDFNLLVVGPEPGYLTNSWKTLAQNLGVSNRVFWTGYLQGEDLPDAYSAADIFSLISTNENFGMVVVEAMACGLPVVVNPEVGIWEDIKQEGVGMAVAQDPEAVAGALADFRQNRPRWASWAENSLNVARVQFAKEKVASLMAQAFEDVLHGTRSELCHWEVASTVG